MEFDVHTIISVGTILVSSGMTWGILKSKTDDIWLEVSKLRNWKDEHEKMSIAIRLEIEKRLGSIDTAIATKDIRYDEIIKRLDRNEETIKEFIQKIEVKFEKLETRLER